jgi:hypothetical protein
MTLNNLMSCLTYFQIWSSCIKVVVQYLKKFNQMERNFQLVVEEPKGNNQYEKISEYMFCNWLGRDNRLLQRSTTRSAPEKKLSDWLCPQPNNTFGIAVDYLSKLVTVRVS